MNCLTRSLDLLHEKGGWFAARASVPNPELYNPGTLRDLNRYLNEVVK